MVLGDLEIDQFAAQCLKAFKRAFFVCSHQPRVPRHIGGEDRGETAALAHAGAPMPAQMATISLRRSSGPSGSNPLLPGMASCLVGSLMGKFVLYHQGLLPVSLSSS